LRNPGIQYETAPMKTTPTILALSTAALLLTSCGKTEPTPAEPFEAVYGTFGTSIPVEPPYSYSSQAPAYIQKDNRGGVAIDDKKATLGRVLFYDKALSDNQTIACGSCHQQAFAFSDTAQRSVGLNGGLTGRHSMRLVNNRFAVEQKMFWDERAIDLQAQVVQPIQDHIEMGFSGTNGQPGVSELVTRLQSLTYYRELFAWVYDGDSTVTLDKMGEALTDFVNSIESYDAKFDDGYTNQAALTQPFSNYTSQENQGKALFLAPPNVDVNGIRTGGGAGCAACHQPPEFDIDPNSRNNGVDHVAGDPASADFTNTRSPSLRDVIGPNGQPNGPMMHTGDFIEFKTVIEHYNEVIPDVNNNTLDLRLRRGPNRLQLELTATERTALEAFVKTLTGSNVYTDARWSDPF